MDQPWEHPDWDDLHDTANDPVRRLNMLELTAEITQAGFKLMECVYRFRDRVALRARRSQC
jgi:hypothetical protein